MDNDICFASKSARGSYCLVDTKLTRFEAVGKAYPGCAAFPVGGPKILTCIKYGGGLVDVDRGKRFKQLFGPVRFPDRYFNNRSDGRPGLRYKLPRQRLSGVKSVVRQEPQPTKIVSVRSQMA